MQAQVPRVRKSKVEQRRTIEAIGKQIALGASDDEIMENLHLKRSQYFVYRARLYEQSAVEYDRSKPRDLIYQKDILKQRLTRLFRRAELDLSREQQSTGVRDKAGVYLAAQNIAINLFKLEHEGLRILLKNAENGNGYLRGDNRESTTPGQVRVLPRKYVSVEERSTGAEDTVTDESTVY